MVKITAITFGCGSVYVSWTTTGNSDVCRITQYNVTISSATVNMIISSCRVNSHNFTELPDDTLFNVSVTGFNAMGFVSNPDYSSVRTMICISTYIYTCVAKFIVCLCIKCKLNYFCSKMQMAIALLNM